MFKLLRYFSITSLVAFAVVVVLLAGFYRQSALSDLAAMQERQHLALTQVFSNSIWPAHAPLVATLAGLPPDQLRARPELARLRQDVLGQMRDTSVIKVKIYSPSGLTLFSTEPGEIGAQQADNAGVIASLAGQVASELNHSDSFNTFDSVIENRDLFSTYIPLRGAGPGGPIVGVFEIYTDVTPFLRQIAATQLRVAGGVALALAALYGVLFVIVRRADRILYREALARQRAAERPWRQALTFENTHDSVVVTGLDGTIIDCNPATQQIFGYPREQVLGADLTLWYRPAELGRLRAELDAEAGGARQSAGALPFTRQDGSAGTCEVIAAPQHDERGQPIGRIWISHDITERTHVEAALIHARDAAEAANQAKSMFLANMSHELRTPLTAILGYADLAEHEAGAAIGASVAESLSRIRAAGHQLLGLINDLLDLARIEAGRAELATETIPIASLVAEVAEQARPLAHQNGNSLTIHCEPGLGLIAADPRKLRQVLLNVLGNAAKFTSHGQISLTVARESAHGSEWVRFGVVDTGIGIAREQIEQLFEPFTQADGSATREYGGAGLGLAISRRLCEMMGGQITAASEPGMGSVFIIYLPALPGGELEPTPLPREVRAPVEV
jgi:PAS domain S-box-containing protein